jgi:hypothetical protein
VAAILVALSISPRYWWTVNSSYWRIVGEKGLDRFNHGAAGFEGQSLGFFERRATCAHDPSWIGATSEEQPRNIVATP